MNPIVFGLRHPVTVSTALAALVLGTGLAVWKMKVDICPALNLPVIYVAQPYGGMDAAQMEGLLTNYHEYHFLYIAGIDHVESRNIQGVALMKLYFHPGTDMAQAMAETINYVTRSRAFMPPGTVAPFVMRFDTGSVPVGYLVLDAGETGKTIGEMQRMALFDVRPIFANLEGVSAPPPFGGSQRTVVLKVDPKLMDAAKVSLQELIAALNNGNVISPSGNIPIGDEFPIVRVNANMKKMQDALPEDIEIDFVFDQSPYVTGAMWGVGVEGMLGAFLTGLMVFVFLRDWRSVIVVVLNIPFALLGAMLALNLSG